MAEDEVQDQETGTPEPSDEDVWDNVVEEDADGNPLEAEDETEQETEAEEEPVAEDVADVEETDEEESEEAKDSSLLVLKKVAVSFIFPSIKIFHRIVKFTPRNEHQSSNRFRIVNSIINSNSRTKGQSHYDWIGYIEVLDQTL